MFYSHFHVRNTNRRDRDIKTKITPGIIASKETYKKIVTWITTLKMKLLLLFQLTRFGNPF